MTLYPSVAAAVTLLTFLPRVLAHGHMNYISIAGKRYDGPDVGKTMPEGSIIRGINDNGPVTSLSSADLACGQGTSSETAMLSADAQAGDSIDFMWVGGGGGTWVHRVGPMQTYVASCGDADCSQFNTANAKWIKIDAAGLVEGTNDWVIGQTLTVDKPHTVSLPQGLPNGNWLLRHEIIALHNAQAVGGAEFYSACAQIKVGGGSNGSSSAKTVSIPGVYNAEDPGIHIDVYRDLPSYTFPGGDVQFGGGKKYTGGGSSSSDDDSTGDGDTQKGGTITRQRAGSCRVRRMTSLERARRRRRSLVMKPTPMTTETLRAVLVGQLKNLKGVLLARINTMTKRAMIKARGYVPQRTPTIV